MKSFNTLLVLVFILPVLVALTYANVSAMEMKDSMMNNKMMDYKMMDDKMMKEKESTMMKKEDKMMKMEHMDSPLKQMKSDVVASDVTYKEGLDLIFKVDDGSAKYVISSAASKLVAIGWATQ